MTAKANQIDRPARQKVAARVKEMICARGLRPGDPLPPYLELARQLGISYVTVKRGLDDLAKEGIIRRVRSVGTFVAKEVDQVSRELKHLGVIYSSSRCQLFSVQYAGEIMSGIAQEAPPSADTHIFSLREDGLIRAAQLGEWGIDGAILFGVENDDYLRDFAQWGTPGVVVDYCSKGAPLDYVVCDNAAAAQRIVAYLASLGHRRVAYVAGNPQQAIQNPRDPQITLLVRDSSDSRERHEESLRALRAHNMQVDDWTFPESHAVGIPATADKLQRSLRAAGRPTAVLVDNNTCALGLLRELENRGLQVPGDISVCAVASDGDMMAGDRILTCCRFDFTGMGRKAIALLAERRTTKPLDAPREHRIGFELVAGATVARPVAATRATATHRTTLQRGKRVCVAGNYKDGM